MRKRLITAGTAMTLALSVGAFGATGVALAGEDDSPPPPPDTQTVPVPAPTQTVTVPGPTQTVTVPGPTKTVTVKTKSKSTGGGSGSTGSTGRSNSSKGSISSPTRQVQISHPATTATTANVDTGTSPVGGVQAGAGGAADHGPSPVALSLALGMLALGLTSGGVALKRRASER
jgi:hypothetical protein